MYNKRIEKLRNAMKDKKIDGILLVGDPNRNYMSGFSGDESFSIITKDKALFITDSRFTEQAKQQVNDYEVVEYIRPFENFLSNIVKELGIKSLGFEENIISYSTYMSYNEAIAPNCELVPLEGMVENLRIIKDKEEIEFIRKAAEIADKTFEHMIKFIKPGMSEREIGLELEFTMKKLGASALSFPSIVASGVRSCLPHGTASDKVVENGDFLTLDYGCVFNGYCSDMTRTIVIGNPTEKMKEIYNIVLEAETKALEAIKEGITGCELDSIARELISEKGYGKYFGHGLGHGVGREVHENPSISSRGVEPLKAGMVITDEPGIYIPDFGGVRIEDLIVVTEEGYEVLSKSSKELICI